MYIIINDYANITWITSESFNLPSCVWIYLWHSFIARIIWIYLWNSFIARIAGTVGSTPRCRTTPGWAMRLWSTLLTGSTLRWSAPSRGKKTVFFAPFYAKNDQFTKTGSGQTQGKHSKKSGVFLQRHRSGRDGVERNAVRERKNVSLLRCRFDTAIYA